MSVGSISLVRRLASSTAPLGVQLASWDALGVWNLSDEANTGPAAGTVFKNPITNQSTLTGLGCTLRAPFATSLGVQCPVALTLDGWDFRGGYHIEVTHNDVIIKNCLFDRPDLTIAAGFSFFIKSPYSGGPYTGGEVSHCTFDGSPGYNVGLAGAILSTNTNIFRNRIIQMPADGFQPGGACNVYENYIDLSGYQTGAHADLMQFGKSSGANIYRNLFIPNPTGIQNVTAIYVLCASGGADDIDSVAIYNNIIGDTFVNTGIHCENAGHGQMTNISIHDNLLTLGTNTSDWRYPTTQTNILSITNTNPAIITLSASSGAAAGEALSILHCTGMTQANRNFYVVSHSLSAPWTITTDIDATGFGVYTGGGTCFRGNVGIVTSSGNQLLSDGSALTEFPIQ